jgi:hypothetical protein
MHTTARLWARFHFQNYFMKTLVKCLAAFVGMTVGILATAILTEMNGLGRILPLQAIAGVALGAIGWLSVSRVAK